MDIAPRTLRVPLEDVQDAAERRRSRPGPVLAEPAAGRADSGHAVPRKGRRCQPCLHGDNSLAAAGSDTRSGNSADRRSAERRPADDRAGRPRPAPISENTQSTTLPAPLLWANARSYEISQSKNLMPPPRTASPARAASAALWRESHVSPVAALAARRARSRTNAVRRVSSPEDGAERWLIRVPLIRGRALFPATAAAIGPSITATPNQKVSYQSSSFSSTRDGKLL